ncbi:hypothetical protein GW17_00040293 [Ensete ventricosum]|nr:hypothetical protein GW17_00040293 [Ensete ventricosum]
MCSVWVARRPPGYGFVEFDDRRDALDAIRDIDGTKVLVLWKRLRSAALNEAEVGGTREERDKDNREGGEEAAYAAVGGRRCRCRCRYCWRKTLSLLSLFSLLLLSLFVDGRNFVVVQKQSEKGFLC